MKKMKKNLLCSLFLLFSTSSIFAQGFAVIDSANLIQSIETVYQTYQQIQNTIQQVQNQYEQIKQKATQMMSININDFSSIGDNFSGLNLSENPFEVITGVRNSAQDVVKAVNNQMDKVNAFSDALSKECISFGGMKVSVADLCGAGDPSKNLLGFGKNAFEHIKDVADETARIYTEGLTYQQKQAIMRKYGMSPRNYATVALAEQQLSDLTKNLAVSATDIARNQALTEAVAHAETTKEIIYKQLGPGQEYALAQLNASTLARTETQLANLGDTLTRGFGLLAQNLIAEETKDAVETQIKEENKQKESEYSSSEGIKESFF